MTKKDECFRFLDNMGAEEKMRKGEMRHIDAVKMLMESFDDTFGAANTMVYNYRKERELRREGDRSWSSSLTEKGTVRRMTFKDEVEDFITDRLLESKLLLEPYFGNVTLETDSGNPWNPDIVIADSRARDSEALGYGVKLIGEIKLQNFESINPKKPKPATHTEHMWRAGARFCDIRNWQVPKYLLFPYLIERPKGFDFNAYFRNMGVTLLDWSKTEHVEMLEKQIDTL